MKRYILSYTGRGEPQPADIEAIRSSRDVVVVDDSMDGMFLVEGTDRAVGDLLEGLRDWNSSAQRSVSLPDSRPRVKRKAE